MDHHLQHSCLWYLVYGSAKSNCQFFHFLIPCTVADLPPRTVLTLVDPSCVAAGPRFCFCCAGALRVGHGTSVSKRYQTSMLQWPLVPFAVQPPAWVRGGQDLWLLPLPLPLPTTLAPGGVLPSPWVSNGALTLGIPYRAKARLTSPMPACLTNVSTLFRPRAQFTSFSCGMVGRGVFSERYSRSCMTTSTLMQHGHNLQPMRSFVFTVI